MASLVLPGEVLSPAALPTPSNPSKSLKVGPGLQKIGSSNVRSVVAGTLVTDNKKNAAWVEVPEGRYIPTLNDPVLALVQRSTADAFLCTLTPHSTPALLPHLSFEGVSKKTRPQFAPNTLVYARVTACPTVSTSISSSSSSSAAAATEVELSCVDPNTGKGDGLGELKGGMLFDVSIGFARRLLLSKQREKGGVAVLEELAEKGKVVFEVAVGRNGRVWVAAEGGDVRRTIAVGRALQETDQLGLGVEEQRRLVKRLLKGI